MALDRRALRTQLRAAKCRAVKPRPTATPGGAVGVMEFGHEELPRPVQIAQKTAAGAAALDQRESTIHTLVWPCSPLFARFLCDPKNRGLFEGKTVLELGAGNGLPGIVAGMLGAKSVVITDVNDALPLIRKNVEVNEVQGNVTVAELFWGREEHMTALEKPFDLIIGTDLIANMHEETYADLVRTLRHFSGPETLILIAYEFRGDMWNDHHFFDGMDSWFHDENGSLAPYAEDFSFAAAGCSEAELGDPDDYMLFRYRMKSDSERTGEF
mmetsp:Transcript_11953/g.26414  ORF Transcript_11953/g.26414 Transcript_11953/m.26414 type:complete len:270 (-) Transcript_11953:211-1020(-)